LPLIEMRHDDPGAIMQRENAGPSRASLRIGAALVIAQMAACTLLIISSGLLYSGYRSSLQAGAGRRLSGAAIASVEATQMSSESQQATNGANYFGAAERAATELLAPTEIAWTAIVPGDRPVWRTFVFENTNLPPRTLTLQRALFTKRSVDRIVTPPLEGRLFGAFDSGDCGGVVLSAAAARQLGTGRVVGRSIETPSGEWSQVIGVARLRDAEDDALVFHYAPDAEDVAPEPLTYRVPSLTDTPPVTLHVNVVSSNYFDLLGLPLRAGRPFADRPDPCRVAIINEEAASRYFNGDAINGAIIDDDGTRTRIIGVVGSARLRAAQRDIPPTVYLPMGQDFQPRMTMMMETGSVSAAALRRLHRRLALIPGGRENRIIVNTLDRHLSRTALAPERITTVLVGASASIALALGMLGLYGVMSDASRRRRRELALRLALGARGAHVARQVLSEGLRLVAIGALLGTAGSLAVARWIASIAPASDGPSAVVWMAIPLALLGAVGIASVVPARAAAAIDPLVIMRRE
jgi:hypothetical protein